MEHSFDIELASQYGIEEAILLKNIQFWIAKNKANNKHFYEGKYWTYNSMAAFAELFPYMTENQIKYAIGKLVDNGVLLKASFNENKFDKTQWYSLVDGMELPETIDILSSKGENSLTEEGKFSLLNSNTDSKPDNKQKKINKKKKLYSLEEWEEINGRFSLKHLKEWGEKNNLDPAKVKSKIEPFRDAILAKGYEYKDFVAVFRTWHRDKMDDMRASSIQPKRML